MSLPLVLCAVLLAGESVRFDDQLRPTFTATAAQVRITAPATRDGLAEWAQTAAGKTILRRFLVFRSPSTSATEGTRVVQSLLPPPLDRIFPSLYC